MLTDDQALHVINTNYSNEDITPAHTFEPSPRRLHSQLPNHDYPIDRQPTESAAPRTERHDSAPPPLEERIQSSRQRPHPASLHNPLPGSRPPSNSSPGQERSPNQQSQHSPAHSESNDYSPQLGSHEYRTPATQIMAQNYNSHAQKASQSQSPPTHTSAHSDGYRSATPKTLQSHTFSPPMQKLSHGHDFGSLGLKPSQGHNYSSQSLSHSDVYRSATPKAQQSFSPPTHRLSKSHEYGSPAPKTPQSHGFNPSTAPRTPQWHDKLNIIDRSIQSLRDPFPEDRRGEGEMSQIHRVTPSQHRSQLGLQSPHAPSPHPPAAHEHLKGKGAPTKGVDYMAEAPGHFERELERRRLNQELTASAALGR